MNLSENLKLLRTKKELRQSDVANSLGIAVSTYTKYETGANQPDLIMLIKLSEFYHVTPDQLLGIQNTQTFNSKISQDEKALLQLYRQLSEQAKGKLQERAKVLLEDELYSKHQSQLIKGKKGIS